MSPRHIILSPHFDDGALSLGGLIARDAAHCAVITVFGGKPEVPVSTGWDRLCGFKNSNWAYSARRRENESALAHLHVAEQGRINWPFLDAQYRTADPRHEDALLTAIASKLIEYLSALEGQVSVYAPIFTFHSDHALTKAAMLRAMRALPSLQYFFYQDLPYVARDTDTLTRATLQPTHSPFSESEMQSKLGAIARYKSQSRALDNAFGFHVPSHIRETASNAARGAGGSGYCETIYRLDQLAV